MSTDVKDRLFADTLEVNRAQYQLRLARRLQASTDPQDQADGRLLEDVVKEGLREELRRRQKGKEG